MPTSPPQPRQRGVSMGSSGIDGGYHHGHRNSFSRYANGRKSATEKLLSPLSSSAASTAATQSTISVDEQARPRGSMERAEAFRAVRRGSDPMVNEDYYATQMKMGNFVKMGWLTKQGHMWKSWKTRFFVLFSDGTFAYYKNKGKKKMQGCMMLNDGVVSIQHVDIRKVEKAQFEAELWVAALRSARRAPPPCFEIDLTAAEEKTGANAVTRQLNKIFVTDREVAHSLDQFKLATGSHPFDAIQSFILLLDDNIIDRHHLALYKDMEIEMLPGNELIKLIRRHVEDRVFVSLAGEAYASLETTSLRFARNKTIQNLKLLSGKPQRDFGVADDLSAVSDWGRVAEIVNSLDCVSLPSHKIEIIIAAGMEILDTIARYHGALFDVTDETLSAIFRYVLVKSYVDDICILHALLTVVYKDHPACQNTANIVEAFLDAIKWIEGYESNDHAPQSDGMSLAASRIKVSISTKEIGIQFTTDGNGRGAIVHSIRKLSQAALSEAIIPGLSLIAINDEPVVLMPFREICRRLRSAALPKRLTFMTEFYYYQVLSLDAEMFKYLMCLAAARGDKDSAAWFIKCHVNINELCEWGKARGKQVFGFKPPSSKSAPLFAAAFYGQGSMVKYLLGLGADPNLLNRKGKNPLHVVAQTTDMAVIIEALINAGAEIDAADKLGYTPLMCMCSRGSLEGAATFLALGADIHKVAWSNGYTPLDFCVLSGNLGLIDLCLSKGANPNAQTFEGETCLHLAMTTGDTNIILRLIEGGANPNMQNRYGQTPAGVLLALPQGQVQKEKMLLCLEILACSGCRLDKRDIFGRQVLHLAANVFEERMLRLVRKMGSLSLAGESDTIDIFGCCAKDYNLSSRDDNEVPYLIDHKPQDSWKVTGTGTQDRALTSRSYRIDDLVHTMIHDVTVDFADIVSFVLFLESFSSLNEVVERLRAQTMAKNKGRGLIRLFVMLTIFKRHSVTESQYVRDRFYATIQHFTGVEKDQLAAQVEEYEVLYNEYFGLQGTESCLEQYKKVSLEMEELYNPYSRDFTEAFPVSLHRHTEPAQWAEHCTLLTHALFSSIPDSSRERAEVISFFLSVAEYLLSLQNFDTLAAILYALQSTAVQRLRRTIDHKLLHVSLLYDTEESRYARSLALEPREAGAAPLGDRSSWVTSEDLDIENEVRESIGSEGTFGIRQWLRKQKVVHRNRSKSSAQVAQYEWV
ncbi:Alternate phospholipase, partial [Globisporangium splendens]